MIMHSLHQKTSINFTSLHPLDSPFFTSFHFWTFRHHTSKKFTKCFTIEWPRHHVSSSNHSYLCEKHNSAVSEKVESFRFSKQRTDTKKPFRSVHTVILIDTTTGLQIRNSFCISYFCKYI